MARKKTEIQAIRSDVAIYPIGVAARLLNVHPRTLRIYEQEGLIRPTIIGKRRMFSAAGSPIPPPHWSSVIR